MTDTQNLSLPLLSPSQAQKHVTVNEALARLDGMVQLRLTSLDQTTPPAAVEDGTCYGVPAGAVNEWAGQEGMVALAQNGGWVFVAPAAGWRAWVLDAGGAAVHDGADWRVQAVTVTPGGAGLAVRSVEADVEIAAGASVTAALEFPARTLVLGATGRVIEAITGTATGWSLGDGADAARFGSGLGLALNSWVSGPAAPFPVWAPTPLLLSAEGGDFATGRVRLAVHFAALALPVPV